MSEKARTTVSKTNKYYISKNRRRELKYFCLQYPEWLVQVTSAEYAKKHDEWDDPTGEKAIKIAELDKCIDLITDCCDKADPYIGDYIFMSVTEDIPYKTLYTIHHIPCSRKYFTEKRLKFFYILSQEKHLF